MNDSSDVRFMHFRLLPGEVPTFTRKADLLPKGGLTVAYKVETYSINGDDAKACVTYSLAFCNGKDHYNKKLGRAISKGRFDKGITLKMVAPLAFWFEQFCLLMRVNNTYQSSDGRQINLVNCSQGPNLTKRMALDFHDNHPAPLAVNRSVGRRLLDAIGNI